MSGFFRYPALPGGRPLRPLAWVIATCDIAAAGSLVGLVVVMVAVVSAQVVLRYLFNSSIDWADEMSRLCFVWSIFLAIPLGFRSGSHIGIQMLASRLPQPLRMIVARLVAAAGAALLLLVAWESAEIAWEQWDELLSSIPASAAWFVLPLVVAGIHGALHLSWQALTGAVHGDPAVAQEVG